MPIASTPHDAPARRRFEFEVGGEVAFARYVLDGGTIAFVHTVVPVAARGHGVATRLVEAGLEAARERGLQVVPRCATFAAYMRKHPETHDLLAPEGRALLDEPPR